VVNGLKISRRLGRTFGFAKCGTSAGLMRHGLKGFMEHEAKLNILCIIHEL